MRIKKLVTEYVRRAFSNSASHYDALSGMQYEIGRELISKIELPLTPSLNKEGGDVKPPCMVDIGMGTGKLTNRLAVSFSEAKVIGLDLADGMVAQAKRTYETFQSVQGNATALPFPDGHFDLAFSNLAYQWVEDISAAFKETYRVLKPDGKFYATIFGERTLAELFESLEHSGTGRSFRRLHSRETIEAALQAAGFRDIEISVEMTKTQFETMSGLLRWLKDIGANVLNRKTYLGPRHLHKAGEYYQQHFSGRWGVAASFEVIWISARR